MRDPGSNEKMTSRVKTELQERSVAPGGARAGERRLADEASLDARERAERQRWPKDRETVPDAVLTYAGANLSSL